MGQWLQSHTYLAAWLALPIMVITGIIQNVKTEFKEVDWSRSLIYISFCICLGLAFTPYVDTTARMWARDIADGGFVFLIIDRKQRS